MSGRSKCHPFTKSVLKNPATQFMHNFILGKNKDRPSEESQFHLSESSKTQHIGYFEFILYLRECIIWARFKVQASRNHVAMFEVRTLLESGQKKMENPDSLEDTSTVYVLPSETSEYFS